MESARLIRDVIVGNYKRTPAYNDKTDYSNDLWVIRNIAEQIIT